MAEYSGTITAGGVAQTAAAADADRIGIIIQNSDDTDAWYRFGGTAAAVSPSFYLAPGETHTWGREFRSLICQTVSIFGTTTGKTFTIVDGKG
jgi:hypothetical protein